VRPSPRHDPFRLRESLARRFVLLLASLRGACTLAANLAGLETLRPEHQERARRLLQAQHALDRAWCQLRAEIAAEAPAQAELTREAA